MKRIIPVLLALVLVLPPGAGAQQNTLEEFFDSLNLDTRDDGGWVYPDGPAGQCPHAHRPPHPRGRHLNWPGQRQVGNVR